MRSVEANKTGRKGASRDKIPPPEDDGLVYDTTEMRAKLKCGKTMLHHLMKTGQLKYRKLGNKTVFLHADYKALLAALPVGTPRHTAA